MKEADFVVIGSGGGGGTISWLLARSGFRVVMLEAGPNYAKTMHVDSPESGTEKTRGLTGTEPGYDPVAHDEYRFRLKRPEPTRRPRGDYNTFRTSRESVAAPFASGWTASVLGGGTALWGTWSFRPLPVDFRLRTHFQVNGQLEQLEKWGYSIPDWPVDYNVMEPFYNVAETLLAVSGDRKATNEAIRSSGWFKAFASQEHFRNAGMWESSFDFPCSPYPRTPVGHFIFEAAEKAGLHPLPLPNGMAPPTNGGYSTRRAIEKVLRQWKEETKPSFWGREAKDIWSERVRGTCNMCGFCGEYLCWGQAGNAKSGSLASTIPELENIANAEIVTNARAFEITYDSRLRRATGVRYLNTDDPDHPRMQVQKARHVIVSCGAVQSSRLLLMSGPAGGLGNSNGQVGRYAMFHLFGLSATSILPDEFQGSLHSEFGDSGNTSSFEHYFIHDESRRSETSGKWWKAGTVVGLARVNPLEHSDRLLQKGKFGLALLREMELHSRTIQLMMLGDDLPLADNRVDLDPSFVDEYGFPVARITRRFGSHELLLCDLAKAKMNALFDYYKQLGLLKDESIKFSSASIDAVGDHQMGTCRMGDDPAQSVIDRFCRLHEVPNVFVVDSSFFPTGFGVNPMVTIVANALRVGTWIIEESKRGSELG
jgi:choline dehydrogenase-like flavoprotein